MNDGSWRWSKERVERLKKLWADGFSGRQIAERLGGGITRNAAIAKAWRLGLEQREATHGSKKHALACKLGRKKPKSQSPWRAVEVHGAGAVRGIKSDGFVPPIDMPAPEHQRKTVVTLEKDDCRWPIGDPQHADFHFCGAEKVPGLPYCGQHAARAYQPPKTRVVREITHMPAKETEDA